jgi:hypothetical protein
MPHGMCLLWSHWLITLHTVSDIAIALSYYAIPGVLFYTLRKHKYALGKFQSRFLISFGAFILLCGTTHVINIVVLFIPIYWFEGTVKAMTAIVSVLTACLIVPYLPREALMRQATAAIVNLRIFDESERAAELDRMIQRLRTFIEE